VPDVATRMQAERKQYVDGVNNLDYWTGKSAASARTDFIYYYESELTAVRWRQWKTHFATKEDYYAPIVKQSFPVTFNLRADPYESFDSTADRSTMLQTKQWLEGPILQVLGQHMQSLLQYPPVQLAATYDFSKMMEQMQKGAQ